MPRNTATIRLIDVGMDPAFTIFADTVELTIGSFLTRQGERPMAEVETVRTRDLGVGTAALLSDALVLHVTGHGSNRADEVGWSSDDEQTFWGLEGIYECMAAQDNRGTVAPIILVDSCNAGMSRFATGIQWLLQKPCIYIASRRVVTWPESTAYSSAFYAALLTRYNGHTSAMERGYEAALAANRAYREVRQCESPFEVRRLEPL